MLIQETALPGVLHLEPRLFKDNRGLFTVPFEQGQFEQWGIPPFVQDNLSISVKNTIRGLHFQAPPFAQGKLVRVVYGAALDVVVDLRQGSATFGQHLKVTLSAETMNMLWIPEGFAHGFAALAPGTIFEYKVTAPYSGPSERTLLWNDPSLNIEWGIDQPILSEKDQLGTPLAELKSPFVYETV
jgi:dTDP-4-dehydrorhamnose 3,5-epimerase